MPPQKMEAALDKTQPPGLHAGKHLQGHHHRRVLPGDSRKYLSELSFGDVKGFLAGPHPRVPFGRTGEKMSRTVIVHGKPVCVPHPFSPSLSFPGKETMPFPSRFHPYRFQSYSYNIGLLVFQIVSIFCFTFVVSPYVFLYGHIITQLLCLCNIFATTTSQLPMHM